MKTSLSLSLIVCLSLVLPALSAATQDASAPPLAPEPATRTPQEQYRVGGGDVLEIAVFGHDDLSRLATVQPSGAITLPLLGEVQVAELTATEIKRKLASLLERDYLVNPQIEVKVHDFQSQFVTVLGEANSPGRKPLRGPTRLIDVLVEAGGFTPRASGQVTITRAEGFGSGEREMRVSLSAGSPSLQDQINLELPMRHGDIVTASAKAYVTVEGEVTRPGRYVLDIDLTLMGVISTAGGLTRFGSEKIKIRRVDPKTGETTLVTVNLKDVRKGKEQDLPLEPNDVISISRRLF